MATRLSSGILKVVGRHCSVALAISSVWKVWRQDEALQLLLELYQWQTREEFQYTHKWQEHMFVMWDNRSVLHRANGGYDGYDRVLHRITVAADPQKYLKSQPPERRPRRLPASARTESRYAWPAVIA